MNNKQDIDQLIKKYLGKKMANRDKFLPGKDCPTEFELSDYLEKQLSQEKENLLLEHIANCPHCLSLLELGQRAKEKTEVGISPEMITRAEKLAQRSHPARMANFKWPTLALISFILSFVFAKYFMQFLILAVIFSLKWVFDTASTRTLIMVYQAWRRKDKDTAQRIIQDFQDKIGQRR